MWAYRTIRWLDHYSFSDQSFYQNIANILLFYTYYDVGLGRCIHNTYKYALTPHKHTHMVWYGGFLSPWETWVALYYAGVPIATAAAAADRAGSVCVCVCLRERSRLALRWESMQTLQEERRIWGFYKGTPVEHRPGCARVCMHVCVNTCACVCNGGSPVPCLQPCVHSQQSVCGEYDGKVHAHSLPAYSAETLGNQNCVTYFSFICVCHISLCLIVIYASLYVCNICVYWF